MKKLSKRFLTLVIACVMVMAMAVPAFADFPALTNTKTPLYAWNGSYINGTRAALTFRGLGYKLIVRNGNLYDANYWTLEKAADGNYCIRSCTGACVNIYRVAQSATGNFKYYYCTGYNYDSATQGRDQRVYFPSVNGRNCICLAAPLVSSSQSVSGKWYMMTDITNPSAQSDVIWYGDASMAKAGWTS